MARRSRRKTFSVRYGDEWWSTRKKALEKTNYTCDCCGKAHGRRIRLQVHHIVPWNFSPSNALDNLAPLCFHCHKAVHKLYRECPVVNQTELLFKALYNTFKMKSNANASRKRGARAYRRAVLAFG